MCRVRKKTIDLYDDVFAVWNSACRLMVCLVEREREKARERECVRVREREREREEVKERVGKTEMEISRERQ